MQSHKNSRHERIKYECEQCDKTYLEMSNLRRHQKQTHWSPILPNSTVMDQTEVKQEGQESFLNAKGLKSNGLAEDIHTYLPMDGNTINYNSTNSSSENVHSVLETDAILVSIENVEYEKCEENDKKVEDILERTSTNSKETININQTRKFQCDQCEYKATKTSHLQSHKNSKHEGIEYECEQCPKTYLDISNLRRHQKKSHWSQILPNFTIKDLTG